MTDNLRRLIEKLRDYQMTPEELREQAISFAYGNGHMENSRITREGCAQAYDELEKERLDAIAADEALADIAKNGTIPWEEIRPE